MSRFGKGPAEWNLRVQTGGRFTWSAQRACVGSSRQAESWRSYWSGAGDLRWYPVGGWAQNRWWRGQAVAWSYVTQVGGWSSCAMCATLWMCSFPHTQAFALTPMGVSRVQHPGERDLLGSCRCWSGVRLWWKAGNWPSQGYFAVEEAATMPPGWKNWLTPLFCFFFFHPILSMSVWSLHRWLHCLYCTDGWFLFFPQQRRNQTWSGRSPRGHSDLRLSKSAQQMSFLWIKLNIWMYCSCATSSYWKRDWKVCFVEEEKHDFEKRPREINIL